MASILVDEPFMRAVLEQMAEQNFTLDYDRMAAALGEGVTKNAVKHRWYKLKKALVGDKAAGGMSSLRFQTCHVPIFVYFLSTLITSTFLPSQTSIPKSSHTTRPKSHTHTSFHTAYTNKTIVMSSSDEILMRAILEQHPDLKIDYDLLAQAIGCSTKHAAQCRMSRFRAKLAAGASGKSPFRCIRYFRFEVWFPVLFSRVPAIKIKSSESASSPSLPNFKSVSHHTTFKPNTPKSTSTPISNMSADDILMHLLLEQIDTSGFKFDYDALSQSLGTKKNAAFMRVSRFKSRLAASASGVTSGNFFSSRRFRTSGQTFLSLYSSQHQKVSL